MYLTIEPIFQGEINQSIFFSDLISSDHGINLKLALLPPYKAIQFEKVANDLDIPVTVIGTESCKIDPFLFIRGSFIEKANKLCDMFNLIENKINDQHRSAELLLLEILLIETNDHKIATYDALQQLLTRIQVPEKLVDLLERITRSELTLTTELSQQLEKLSAQLKSVKKNEILLRLNQAANRFINIMDSSIYQSLFTTKISNLALDQVSLKDFSGVLIISSKFSFEKMHLLLNILNSLITIDFDLYLDVSLYTSTSKACFIDKLNNKYNTVHVLTTENDSDLSSLFAISRYVALSTETSQYEKWLILIMRRMHISLGDVQLAQSAIKYQVIKSCEGCYTAITEKRLAFQLTVTKLVQQELTKDDLTHMLDKKSHSRKTSDQIKNNHLKAQTSTTVPKPDKIGALFDSTFNTN